MVGGSILGCCWFRAWLGAGSYDVVGQKQFSNEKIAGMGRLSGNKQGVKS